MYGKKRNSVQGRNSDPSEIHPQARFLGVKDPDFVLPGFGSRYRGFISKGSIKPWNKRSLASDDAVPKDHREVKGRWLNTQRRGGVIGRDHQRRLPLKPL